MAVLAALLEHPHDDHYGLELAHQAGIRAGSIYPILARLESCGWLIGHWEDIDESTEGRRRRKYFRLTGEGERCATDEIKEWSAQFQHGPRVIPELRGLPA
jgi:PadR family transcriptional regulator, regulatory protein PadR